MGAHQVTRQSRNEYQGGNLVNGYDYDLQVWVRDGKVVTCGHPHSMGSTCCNANAQKYGGMNHATVVSVKRGI